MTVLSPTSERPILLIKSGGAAALPEWQAHFQHTAAHLQVRDWNDPLVDPALVRYALVWEPDAGRLKTYPHLQAILSSAAGVDHILADPELPTDLPIIRMVTGETQQAMSEFAAMACLMLHKGMPQLIDQQRRGHWKEFLPRRPLSETRVGILGLGALGAAVATYLCRLGFPVQGWSRTLKQIDGVTCLAGAEQLPEFLAQTDLLVCLLPGTEETRQIINAQSLAQLPRGASVINLGRGSHVDLPALLAALDSGQLDSAWLDVFEVEPLPVDDAVWQHPRLIVSPHNAANPSRAEKAKRAGLSIAAIDAGRPAEHVYDRVRGY